VLHVTNLFAEACPYLRYDMEDVVTYRTDPCECGRTSLRMKVRGRLAWSVRTPAGYIFSTDVEHVLWGDPRAVGADYQLVRQRRQPQDDLTVRVALEPGAHPGLAADLSDALSAELGVPVRAEFVGESGIERAATAAKRQRVIDEPA
jgi:phenylacetate-CoA ligase